MVAYRRLKTIENFKLSGLKVVTNRRWSITGGTNHSELTRKRLVFWKSGRLREVITQGGSTVLLITRVENHDSL